MSQKRKASEKETEEGGREVSTKKVDGLPALGPDTVNP
jgi:hypothetical protein